MRGTLVWLTLACCAGGSLARAQTQDAQAQDVRELKKKVQQLEQLTQQLQAQLAALEKQKTDSPRVVSAKIVQPESAGKTSQPATASNTASAAQPEIVVSTGEDSSQQEATYKNEEAKAHLDLYGFAMLDLGYDINQNDPDWFDVVRPTKLPSFPDEFGRDGRLYTGVRQSRLGARGYFPTPFGELKTIFEFELFGVGPDAGQTTFRLRHAWGELGHFGGGQTWSTFMDPDVFPNSIELLGAERDGVLPQRPVPLDADQQG